MEEMAEVLVIFLLAVPRHGLSSITEDDSYPGNSVDVEDAYLKVPDIIQKNGYPFEDHYVTTDDGYILNIHRIPHGKSEPLFPSDTGPVVFVMHGLVCSSAVWINAGPDRALGYVLADAGYDVWLGNARGNTYSRRHVRYDPYNDSKEFWNYSWHEIGVHDLPAMIDYTLQQTKKSNLFYIGQSQGTSTFYVMASEKPEYNEKIRVQFSLSPIAYMNHLRSPVVQAMARFTGLIKNLLNWIGVYEFMPNDGYVSTLSARSIKTEIGVMVYTNMFFSMFGFDKDQLETSLLPTIVGHYPAGSSTMQLLHYGQGVLSGEFRQYDLGTVGNQEAYGDEVPPNYPLEHITCPVYLFYSRNDWVSSEEDVLRLAARLPNLQGMFLVNNENWNHMDYLWGVDAKTLVYDEIIRLMKESEL